MPVKTRLAIVIALILCGTAAVRAQSLVAADNPWSHGLSEDYRRLRLAQMDESAQTDAADRPSRKNRPQTAAPDDAAESASTPDAATPSRAREEKVLKPSALETMYAGRIVERLEQFGYDMFGVPHPETRANLDEAAARQPAAPMGAVQDDFILNSGDEVEVVFTGQRNDRGTYKIDSKGLILIPDFPPIPAAGRSIGQVRISVEAAARNLHNTEAYISLSGVRQIGVLVIGHVVRPGRQTLTVFHTALDALMEAGGVQKTGSLRQIKLIRDGRGTILDLYALLLHGGTQIDLQLRDGDRIIVPAIGPTVAVSGEVKRPGIFEILPAVSGMHAAPQGKSEKLSLNDMLALGGGVMGPGDNRFIRLAVTPDGKESVGEVKDPFLPLFGDGSILTVSKGKEKRAGTTELSGNARRPGLYPVDEYPTLSRLLKSEDMLDDDTYPLIGVIERTDKNQLTRTLHDFPLRLVLKGAYDRSLQDGDVVHLFSNAQIRRLTSPAAPAAAAEQGSADEGPADPAAIDDVVIASFLRERAAFVRGAVHHAGAWPVAEGVTLDSVLAVAGGMALEADAANIEVTSALQGQGGQDKGRSGTQRLRVNLAETSPASVPIGPGDSVRVNQKFRKIEDSSVLVIGEVRNPGRYDLIPGDKLSDLLARAGGLTQQAYAPGAIFSRESERKAEESRFRAQARAMRKSIAAALETDEKKIDAGKLTEARALAEELESADGLGRITVEADPAVLKTEPELDMLLQPGDRLYIPKRSLSVRVSGEILSPATLQFRENKKPLDYIHEAGGFTFNADDTRTFVLYPDGSAQPLQVSAWNYKPVFIPPGSTIVVPRDPKPFDFVESAKDISQILSNLAVTAIFINDVRNDD